LTSTDTLSEDDRAHAIGGDYLMSRLDRVPVRYMRGAMLRYIVWGAAPAHFLSALISNDLRGVFERADDSNLRHLHDWVKWLYNDAPSGCWGSPAKFQSWMAAGGLVGFGHKEG
jgi:hypothetical protein